MELEKQMTPSLNNSYVAESDPGFQSDFLCSSKIDLITPWVEPEFYFVGNGVKLKNIPGIINTIESASNPFIEVLHHLLFLCSDKEMCMHRNILEFSGFNCESENIDYEKRLKILMLLSDSQLELISRGLCISLSEYSRQAVCQAIINFIALPFITNEGNKVLPVSRDESDLYFNNLDVDEIILKVNDPKFVKIEESPAVHNTSKSVTISTSDGVQRPVCESVKEAVQESQVKPSEMKILNVPSDKDALSSELQFTESQEQTFTRMIELPNVLEVCHNYDLSNQRELFSSGMTLTLTPGNYIEQAITNEEAEFRLACANYMKNFHANQHQLSKKKNSPLSRETEEQAAIRRAQNAQRMRNYRQNLRAQETEEQAAARRAQNALRVRNYRKFKKAQPELANQYRSQNALRMRVYRERLRALETEEEAAARRARNAERVKLYRKLKQGLQPDVFRAENAKRMREYRQNKVETPVTSASC